MEKLRAVYNYASSLNFAYLLILGLLGKALISDVSYATFLLTIPVLGYEGYKLYIKSKTPDAVVLDAELRKELDNIKSKINAGNMDKGVNAMPKRYF
jgi:hypothetical protein